MIVWLTGNTGAGKTTIARALRKINPSWINLDGDEMRTCVTQQLGLSREGRFENCLRIAKLARILDEQGHNVIVSVIAPYKELRAEIDEVCAPAWVYVELLGKPKYEDSPYEIPTHYSLKVTMKEYSELARVIN